MAGDDLTQHYLGWKAYRAGSWEFPIGLSNTLSYPYKMSVIFTDSIPIFAVLFKILSPVLPGNFQYFGLWGLLCFILQGIMTARILKHYINDPLALILSAVLFSFTPVMLWRMYVHTSLAGQWLLLMELEPLFCYDRYKDNNKIFPMTLLTGLLAASIHTYFILMCGIILLGICVIEVRTNHKIYRAIGSLSIYILSAAFVTWVLGGFSSQVGSTAGGLGYYSANLNAFVNPQDWSAFFKTLPLYAPDQTSGQHEGFAYLGAGCMLLLILALFFYIEHHDLKAMIVKYRLEIIAVSIVAILGFIIALSPVITLNEKVIADLHTPRLIKDVWAVFRSSGRIIWIDVYIVMIVAFILLFRSVDKKIIYIALVSVLLLQVYDSKNELIERHRTFFERIAYESDINEDTWNTIRRNKSIRHLVYNEPWHEYGVIMNSLTNWALDNDLTMNDFYFARTLDPSLVQIYRHNAVEQPSEENLIIFPMYERVLLGKHDLHYYEVDDVIVGYKNKIQGLNEIAASHFQNIWHFGDDEYLKPEYGYDTEEGRIIYPDGASYGPNWHIPEGNYELMITGENIPEELEVSLYSGEGAVFYDYSVIKRDTSVINISVVFNEEVLDLGIALNNHSGRDVLMKEIALRYIDDPG